MKQEQTTPAEAQHGLQGPAETTARVASPDTETNAAESSGIPGPIDFSIGPRSLADGLPRVLISDPDTELDISGEDAIKLLREMDADACRGSLSEFVRLAFAVVNPAVELEWGPHLQAICDHIQWQLEDRDAVVRARSYHGGYHKRKLKAQNLLINVPPRSLKTVILSLATVWAWLRWPTLKIMYLSANPRVAATSARMARDLIHSDWFQTTFSPQWSQEFRNADGDLIDESTWLSENASAARCPQCHQWQCDCELWQIRQDQDALSDLGNTAGGSRAARGLSSQITGEGCEWLCVARGTLVATEIGDVAIEALLDMPNRPRVWTQNHKTSERELNAITGWHRTESRPTVTVRTVAGNVLRCTGDHRIWTAQGYKHAEACTGSTVSVLRRAECTEQPGRAAQVPCVCSTDADVCRLRQAVSEGCCRTGQGDQEISGADGVRSRVSGRRASEGASRVRPVRKAFRQGPCAGVLFSCVLGRETEGNESTEVAERRCLRVLQDVDCAAVRTYEVLFDVVQERSAQRAHDRRGQLELHRNAEDVLRRAVGEYCPSDSRAGRMAMHGMWCTSGYAKRCTGDQSAPRPPHRPRSEQQCRYESDHVVRLLPHDPPQVSFTSVLSVVRETERGCGQTDDVYDINVEGNHNFFANGILVHNCIDDPSDTRDSMAKVAKAVEDYNSAVHNRLNSPHTSIRTLIMQRVRPNDLSADWVANHAGKLVHLRLPMEFESVESGRVECKCGTCAGPNVFGFVDWRTADGEVLHPRFDASFLEGERKRLGAKYVGQHQQRPLEAGGTIFKVGHWSWFTTTTVTQVARPLGARLDTAHLITRRRDGSLDLDFVDISIDASGGSMRKDASNLGMGIIGGKGERRFLLRDMTDGPATWLATMDKVRNAILTAVRLAGKQPDLTVLVEKKALGQALVEQLRKHIHDGDLRYPDGQVIKVRVETYEPTGKGDKEQRADAMEPDIAAGFFHLLDGDDANTGPFRDEVEGFPRAVKDDRVDYLSQDLDYRRLGEPDWVRAFRRKREAEKERLAQAVAAQQAPND